MKARLKSLIKGAVIGALLVLVASLFSCRAQAAPVKLKWRANEDGEHVTEYRIYRLAGDARALLGRSGTLRATVEALPGDALAITAWNGEESVLSDTLTIPASAPPPPPPEQAPAYLRFAIIRERSEDAWKTSVIQQIEEVIVPNPAPASMQWRDRIIQLQPGEPLPVR